MLDKAADDDDEDDDDSQPAYPIVHVCPLPLSLSIMGCMCGVCGADCILVFFSLFFVCVFE